MFKQSDQREIIQSLTQKELYMNLYLTQGIFLLLTIVLSFVFQQRFTEWLSYFSIDWMILWWSLPVTFFVVIIDFFLWKKAPSNWMDDGGINERIFSKISLGHLFLATLMIGVSEELLFRGVLQTNLGYIPASLLFAFMHIRYITKPLLLIFATILSFLLGGIFMLTENLLIPIVIHTSIDFLLGLIIRQQWHKK